MKKAKLRYIPLLNSCPLFLPDNVKCKKIAEIRKEYNWRKIFVNIPYSKTYRPFESAICAVLTSYHLKPIVVKNIYTGRTRICEICKNMLSCNYGITDIWYKSKNVPFELGFMTACGKFNIVFMRTRKNLSKQLSDIQYFDPRSHEGKAERLIMELSEKIPRITNKLRIKKINLNELLKTYNSVERLRKRLKYSVMDACLQVTRYKELVKNRQLKQEILKNYG